MCLFSKTSIFNERTTSWGFLGIVADVEPFFRRDEYYFKFVPKFTTHFLLFRDVRKTFVVLFGFKIYEVCFPASDLHRAANATQRTITKAKESYYRTREMSV